MKPSKEEQNLIDRLVHDLSYHRYRYFELDSPVISDGEYDTLYNRFLKFKDKYPKLSDPIGYVVQSDDTISHLNMMLSLKSTTEIDELKWLVNGFHCYVCEPKIDGLAVELVYKRGKLAGASTRGDGVVGENVFNNARHMTSIPLKIKYKKVDPLIPVYGEVFLDKVAFHTVNKMRVKEGKAIFASPRNAAAGIMRSKHIKPEVIALLRFYGYSAAISGMTSHMSVCYWLEKQGLTDMMHHDVCNNITDIATYIDNMNKMREDFPFEVDGVVIKVDDYSEQLKLGASTKHPKWAMAYKFESEKSTTKLKSVRFQVGRTGIVAPVGLIEDTVMMGRTFKRVSLANEGIIAEKGIMIDDTVLIELAGDVIPAILSPIMDLRTGTEKPIVFPTKCPSCKWKLTKYHSHWRCTNQLCPAVVKGQLVHATGRKALNIRGFGNVITDFMIRHELVTDISDIYLLKNFRDDMINRAHLGKNIVNNLIVNIEKSRKVPLNRFIQALCIENISTGMAAHLAEHFGTIDNLLSWTEHLHWFDDEDEKVDVTDITDDVLSAIEGEASTLNTIGLETAKTFITFMAQPTNIFMIERCIENGMEILPYENKSTPTIRVAFTGTIASPRSVLSEMLAGVGGCIDERVTAKTNYLIIGDSPGKKKISAAKKLGTSVLDEIGFMEMIANFDPS